MCSIKNIFLALLKNKLIAAMVINAGINYKSKFSSLRVMIHGILQSSALTLNRILIKLYTSSTSVIL